MRKAKTLALAVVVGLAVTVLVPCVASADEPMFGVRFGYYASSEHAFAGAEFLVPVTHSIWFNPNVEYVFVDNDTYMTFNADFHYDFPTHSSTYVWAGAGLAVLYSNPDGPVGSSTDVGANFIFGVGHRGPVLPYIQAKLIAKSDTEFVIGVGLRF